MIEKIIDVQSKVENIGGLFTIVGEFGRIDHNTEFVNKAKGNGAIEYIYENETLRVSCVLEKKGNGLILRKDSLTNKTKFSTKIFKCLSRFTLEGEKYECYTQSNVWLSENKGDWAKLNTSVKSRNTGTRSCDGATPMLALKNLYNGKVTAFYLFPNAKWEITAEKRNVNSVAYATVVETGISNDELNLTIEPGETISLPQIAVIIGENAVDFDCWKLHEYLNSEYPRKKLPLVYNTWLYNFGEIDYDKLLKQVDEAASLGFEYFVIDAGWFGNSSNWGGDTGNWFERESVWHGKLYEFSEYVRSKGMQFGLWFEPERAGAECEDLKKHSKHYFNGGFLDFANETACEYIINTISSVIEKYKLGFVKFDYNATTATDRYGSAFYRYGEGQRKFLRSIRMRFPELYISLCASGGFRIDPVNMQYCDSFWNSDNQGLFEGLRLYKDLIKRISPCCIEKWNVSGVCKNVRVYGESPKDIVVNCEDGTWTSISKADDGYVFNFLKGGIAGFSCDLCALPQDFKEKIKKFAETYKQEREFYRMAAAKLLCDTPEITVIEYFDKTKSRIVIHVFTRIVQQTSLTIYLYIASGEYRYNDQTYSAEELRENGVTVGIGSNCGREIVLFKKDC